MADLPSVSTLDVSLSDGWLSIWLNQPRSRNALSSALTADLRTVLNAVRDDRTVRGITLRGRGGVFCAGGDLKSFKTDLQASGARDAVINLSKEGATLFHLFNTMPQVTVVVIEGAAMAGGFGLACCADVAIVQSDAQFGFSETAIGLSPAQIAPYVIQKLGYATARRLLLTAARFDGNGAQELGFADFVGQTATDLDHLEYVIRCQVLRCAPGAVAGTKALLLNLPQLSHEQAVQAAAENFADRMISDEGREGIASFIEKRRPSWSMKPE